jgi:hypothetical protein
MIEFIGPTHLYNWLQQFTNHWDTVIFRLDTPLELFWLQTELHCTPSYSFNSQSQSHIAIDCQSSSKSWCRAPSVAYDQIFITLWQLWSCFCGVPSLTSGRVCLLYVLLALASAVFLGSESLWSRDHILLSQNWDFPFRYFVLSEEFVFFLFIFFLRVELFLLFLLS